MPVRRRAAGRMNEGLDGRPGPRRGGRVAMRNLSLRNPDARRHQPICDLDPSEVLKAFRAGLDTFSIANLMLCPEASVHNLLHAARELERAAR